MYNRLKTKASSFIKCVTSTSRAYFSYNSPRTSMLGPVNKHFLINRERGRAEYNVILRCKSSLSIQRKR